MATKYKQPRNKFAPGAEGDAAFNAPENIIVENTITANPAKVDKRKLKLIEVAGSEDDNRKPIVKAFTDAEGKPVERAFYMLTLSDNRGEVSTTAVNASFMDKIRRRLVEGRPYEFAFEVRVAGKTTYMQNGQPVLHTTSGETLTGFMPVTEAAFGEIPNMDGIREKASVIQEFGADFQNTTFKLIELDTLAKERQAAALKAATIAAQGA